MNNNTIEEPTVIFVHIPKTAGTTLRHIIQHQFQPNSIFEFYRLGREPHKGIDEFNGLCEARKKEIKFVSGHIGFGLHEFLPRPYTYITVLRDPVKRVISHYHFLQARNSVVRDKTLEEFVQTQGQAQNSMTNYLSGSLLKYQLSDPGTGVSSLQCSPETLKLAKKNLREHFKVFGLVERFDETCLLLKRHLGWNIPLFYVKNNVSKTRSSTSSISKYTLSLIEKSNEFDIQLYHYAKDVFEELVSQQGSSFMNDLQDLKTFNTSTKAKLYFTVSSSYKRVVNRVHEVLVRH